MQLVSFLLFVWCYRELFELLVDTSEKIVLPKVLDTT